MNLLNIEPVATNEQESLPVPVPAEPIEEIPAPQAEAAAVPPPTIPAAPQPSVAPTTPTIDAPNRITHKKLILTIGSISLPEKAKLWAQEHKGLAIGGAVGGILLTLVAAGFPLWKKVIQPRLQKKKGQKATGRFVKRDAEDEYIDELLENAEFLEFLEDLAAELE
jgi:hypothetical protein